MDWHSPLCFEKLINSYFGRFLFGDGWGKKIPLLKIRQTLLWDIIAMKTALTHLDFPLVRNDNLFVQKVGEITLRETSLHEIKQMYIHKSTRTSSAFQSITQKGYLFKPCSGMLTVTTFFPPTDKSTGPKVKSLWSTLALP